jgi:hypothetical protein
MGEAIMPTRCPLAVAATSRIGRWLSLTSLVSWFPGGLVVAQHQPGQDSLGRANAHAGHNQHVMGDSAFSALQERGGRIMGVDQHRSAHRFDALPDGGRIELQSLAGDSADVAQIRRHFGEIHAAFVAGDFSTPLAVHATLVPGTALMAQRKDRIRYTLRELPRGAELRLMTEHPEVARAIHEFLAFQRGEHRAPGKE